MALQDVSHHTSKMGVARTQLDSVSRRYFSIDTLKFAKSALNCVLKFFSTSSSAPCPALTKKFNHSTFFVFFSALPRATTALWLAREPMLARRNRAWPPNGLRPRWSKMERDHRSSAPLLLHPFDHYAIHSQR